MIGNVNFRLLMVTPVSLGPECSTGLMCKLRLLWKKAAVPWHALLFPVEAQVCPSCAVHSFFLLCSPGIVDRAKVTEFAFELVHFVDQFLDPVVSCQRAGVFRTIGIATVSGFCG